MASRKTSEPVNSEQLNEQEREREGMEPENGSPTPSPTAGPTDGELEERTAEAQERAGAAELRAEAAEQRAGSLEVEMAELRRILERLTRQVEAKSTDRSRAEARSALFEIDDNADNAVVLDFDRPYGTIVGDVNLGFEQDGHHFGHDRQYVRSLPMKLRGCGRPFNPRLVGHVKPRPGLTRTPDVLEGFREE
jgi:hypothetical protein